MYIALEGVDKVGKSTQVKLLKEKYPNAIFTQEPSCDKFGKIIRNLALSKVDNITQTLLFMADRARHNKNILLPNKDKLIISDRSLISGIAYGIGFDYEQLKKINLQISTLPDLVIILVAKKETLESRLKNKKLDNIEKQGINFLLNVQGRIIKTTDELQLKYLHINCEENENTILNKIIKKINDEVHDMRKI